MNDQFPQGASFENGTVPPTAVPGRETEYSSPNISSPDPVPVQRAAAQPARRVGTFTMGLSLIAAGVVAMMLIFDPNFDPAPIFKLSPAILILLGGEIIASHVIYRNYRLKYDFVSAIFCFFLILGSIGVTMFSPWYEQYGPRREELSSIVATQADNLCYDQLKDNPNILSLDIDVCLGGILTGDTVTIHSLRPEDHVSACLDLSGNYTDKADFAQACFPILASLQKTEIPFSRITLNWGKNEEPCYSLELHNRFQMENNAENLALMVEEYQK